MTLQATLDSRKAQLEREARFIAREALAIQQGSVEDAVIFVEDTVYDRRLRARAIRLIQATARLD